MSDGRRMLSLREEPDFSVLSDAAARVRADPEFTASLNASRRMNRRRAPRRDVDGPVYLGVVPANCERLRLTRIPVSVFKPHDAGWALDLSTQGLAMLSDKPLEIGQRRWLRLDALAARPTILPGRVVGCTPFDEGIYHVRLSFLLHDPSLPQRLGFVDDPFFAVA